MGLSFSLHDCLLCCWRHLSRDLIVYTHRARKHKHELVRTADHIIPLLDCTFAQNQTGYQLGVWYRRKVEERKKERKGERESLSLLSKDIPLSTPQLVRIRTWLYKPRAVPLASTRRSHNRALARYMEVSIIPCGLITSLGLAGSMSEPLVRVCALCNFIHC